MQHCQHSSLITITSSTCFNIACGRLMDMKRCPAGRTGLPVSAYHTCATRAIKTTAKKTLPINAHLPTDTLRWSQKGPHSDFHTVCRSPPRRTSTTCTAQAARCSTALGSSMKCSAAPRRKSARSVSVGSARTALVAALVASRPVRSAGRARPATRLLDARHNEEESQLQIRRVCLTRAAQPPAANFVLDGEPRMELRPGGRIRGT